MGKPIVGQRFEVSSGILTDAAGDLTATIFIASQACKLISASERHGTVAGSADVLNLEKCEAGEDLAAGDLLLTTGWTINSTANTTVKRTAVTTAVAILAAGDAINTRLTTGDGTSYAEGCITLELEYV